MAEVEQVIENIVTEPNGTIIAISGSYKYREPELVERSPFMAFAQGAYSFPQDWWIAIHWANGMNGLYGRNLQIQSERIGQSLDGMFRTAKMGAPYVARLTYAVLAYVIRNDLTGYVDIDDALKRIDKRRFLHGTGNQVAGSAGRYAGGIFTNYAASGGRAGRKAVPKGSKVRKVGKYSHTVLASLGALIRLAAEYGQAVDTVAMLMAILTGSRTRQMDNDLYKDLFQAIMRSDYVIGGAEEKAYGDLIGLMQTIVRDVREDAARP